MQVTVTIKDIPYYLTESMYYKTLRENDEDETNIIFEIEALYLKENTEIKNISDLFHLFHTLRYWIIEYKDYPYHSIFNFIGLNKELEYDEMYETFPELEIIHEIKILIKALSMDKPQNMCTYSCIYNCVLLLKYAHENGCKLDKYTSSNALNNGHLECLKYLHENGCPWPENACSNASLNGHLECLKYAHENGCPWNDNVTSNAAENGHLECLKYAHENGCPWNDYVTSNAAENGHLNCLKYAYENGCQWNDDVTFCASLNGHLDCLKYAVDNKCPCDTYVCTNAALNGNLECLKYLHENGCPWDKNTCTSAALNGHLECLKYAYENGCPINKESYYAAKKGHLEHLQCIHNSNNNGWSSWNNKYRTIIRKSIMLEKENILEYLKYINDNSELPDNEKDITKLNGYVECLLYTHKNIHTELI